MVSGTDRFFGSYAVTASTTPVLGSCCSIPLRGIVTASARTHRVNCFGAAPQAWFPRKGAIA